MTSQHFESHNSNGSRNIDVEQLADEVYRVLLRELKIEQERQQSTNKHPYRIRGTRS